MIAFAEAEYIPTNLTRRQKIEMLNQRLRILAERIEQHDAKESRRRHVADVERQLLLQLKRAAVRARAEMEGKEQ